MAPTRYRVTGGGKGSRLRSRMKRVTRARMKRARCRAPSPYWDTLHPPCPKPNVRLGFDTDRLQPLQRAGSTSGYVALTRHLIVRCRRS